MTSPAESVPAVGVVVATRNRRDSLLRTLDRLASLPEHPPVVVVDNASGDGSADAVAVAHPEMEVLPLSQNKGAFARNLGLTRLHTPFVAFCDDDSWWDPGALATVSALFHRNPRLGLIAARILVGSERRLDPVSAQMREGSDAVDSPGPTVDGFLACGVAVRRAAFLEAGGFCERFLIGAEEELLAIDLRRAGWELRYAEDAVALHMPHDGGRRGRSWLSLRNALWTSWLRKPARQALADTARAAVAGLRNRDARHALLAALRALPWALYNRRSDRRLRQLPARRRAARRAACDRGSRSPPAPGSHRGTRWERS